MSEKPWVYDLPIVKKQRFKVFLPNSNTRIFVTRKQVDRQAHNTACDQEDSHVSYEVTKEPTAKEYQEAINLVKEYLKEEE